MRKIAVLTDSASDIPFEMQKEYGVDILPFVITVDGKSYVEREDIDFEQYYEILARCEGIPSTAHITMMQFLDTFCRYDDAGYTDLLYVSINARGSNTYDAARMAAAEFATEERPDSKLRIHIVDSHSYSMIYGWHVCQAAAKLKNGAELSDVIAYLEDALSSAEAVLSVFTLRFIKKSGRVSAAAAFAGELLGLRPIISMIDGETATVAKVRGDAAVMPGLISYVKKRIASDGGYMIGTTDMENGKLLARLCKKELGSAPQCIFLLGAAVATNTGPNAIAIVFNGAKRR
ncbi:MAG: DegV family protein [Ruthenibacterium sp.]